MRRYYAIIACFLSLFLLSAGITVCASTAYGFETIDLSEEEANQIWQNINLTKKSDPVTLDSIKASIDSFDVSADGRILLGLANNKIAVMDENKLLSFFEFSCSGSFYVKWKDNNILLLLVRSFIIVEFTQDGQMVNMVDADDVSTENNTLFRRTYDRKRIQIGDSLYSLRNDMGLLNFVASHYSQLVKTDESGNMEILYDNNTVQLWRTILGFISVIFFIVLVIATIVYQSKEFQKNGKYPGRL